MSCAVQAVGLSYSYPNGRPALRGVELRIRHGERVAILGPNGAGKTTLMLHLNGLMRGAGRLEVAGLAVEDGTLADLRARVGLVFQDPDDQLFMPTVAEDVAFGPLNQGLPEAEVELRVREALGAVRMADAAERAPHQLSMGERRRVAIATVLASRPSLLVLDEPSANLDPRARRELVDILAGVDRTMLLTTHDLPLAAELCERAVILADGRIVADGECHQLLADAELLARHDLELPAGFALERVVPRGRPAPVSSAAARRPGASRPPPRPPTQAPFPSARSLERATIRPNDDPLVRGDPSGVGPSSQRQAHVGKRDVHGRRVPELSLEGG
jgi:cobalt/nickel transport system ATP-binding protein